MDTLNTGFIWEYDDNSFEEKNMLIDSLPEGFKYRVKKLKINEKSDVKEYVKFQAQIQVNICEKDKAEKFIQMIKNKNDTEMKPTKKEIQRKGFRSQCFNCSRNVRINKNIYMYRFLTFPVLRITLPAWIRVHQQDMTQLLLLGKFEYTGGPIFKVVLEC